MQIEWKEDEAKGEALAYVDGLLSLRISQYRDGDRYEGAWYWEVVMPPSTIHLSGIVDTREQAIELCACWAAKGPDAIRAEVVANLRTQIEEKVKKLAGVDPAAAEQLPGFLSGYHAGLVAARHALDRLGV